MMLWFTRWGRRAVVGLVAAGAVTTSASPARAQPAAGEALAKDAEQLFKLGKDDLDAGRWEAACALFEASMKLVPAVSSQLRIARCREHEDKPASAWEAYNKALTLIDAAGMPLDQQAQAAIFVKNALVALDRRMPMLRVTVQTPPQGLRVVRDGQELPPGALGEEQRVDPGKLEIVAEAPGYQSERRSVTLGLGQHEKVEILLVRLPEPASVPAPVPQPVAVPAPVPPPPGAPAGLGPRRTAGLVIGSIGAIGLGVTTGLGVEKLSMSSAVSSAINSNCQTAQPCSTVGQSFRDTVHAWQTAAIVSLVSSVALVGVGVGLFAPAPRGATSAPRAAVVASLSWAGLRGAW